MPPEVLSILTHPALWIALVYLACVLYVHYRGQARLRFERQLTEHSAIFAPFNTILYLFSAIPKDPFLPTSRFPQLSVLKRTARSTTTPTSRT
jgi:beta-hydroxylase